MDGKYEVFLHGKAVGGAEVSREGLYLRIACRCHLPGGEMLRLWMDCGGKEVDLGLCVPMGEGFGTDKRIPASRCGPGKPRFTLSAKDDLLRGHFVPLSPEEPFRYLHRLENAYLERRNGRVGICIPPLHHEMLSSRPTGQWSEPSTSL